MIECKHCRKKVTPKYSLKIVATGLYNERLPKYTIMVRADCPKGHYLKFVEQTPDLVRDLNEALREVSFVHNTYKKPRIHV
jgi:hypothetical protein